MATFWISEYEGMGNVAGGFAQAPKEPAIATQTGTYTTATSSSVFNAKTNLVGIRCSALGHLNFNAAATASHKPISAGETQFFCVNPGDYVSVYDGTS